MPRRAIFAAALWHVAFILMPLPEFSGPKKIHAFDNAQIAWSGPMEDLSLLHIAAAKPKASGHMENALSCIAAPNTSSKWCRGSDEIVTGTPHRDDSAIA